MLVRALGLPVQVVRPEVEEIGSGQPPHELVAFNARLKADAGLAMIGGDRSRVVIGVDTDVAVDGVLLGKPADRAGAAGRLRRLSGRSHEALSGVALAGAVEADAVETSRVTFHDLGETALRVYLDSGEWQDRAGGYAIQGLGASLVESIAGDLANVIGLPLALLKRLLGPESLP